VGLLNKDGFMSVRDAVGADFREAKGKAQK
jgi:hypothetical protein